MNMNTNTNTNTLALQLATKVNIKSAERLQINIVQVEDVN